MFIYTYYIFTPSAQIGEEGLNNRINSYDEKPVGPWTAHGTRVLRYMCLGWFWGTGGGGGVRKVRGEVERCAYNPYYRGEI